MKKPTKIRQRIREDSQFNFEGYLTLDKLSDIVKKMEEQNIEKLELDSGYNNISTIQYRLETTAEAKSRYEKEIVKYNKWKEQEQKKQDKRRQSLIKEAKKLGLKVEE